MFNIAWSAITYYVLIAIITDVSDPLHALINSLKGVKQTFASILGLEIFFWVVADFMVRPLGIFLGGLLAMHGNKAIALSVAFPISYLFGYIKMIGSTLLYLDYKKELSIKL